MTRTDRHAVLTAARIPWAQFSSREIEAIAYEARTHGDDALYRRARAALARRGL